MILIIRQLALASNMEAIANLRLVSKAWLAAVREHPMTLDKVLVEKCGDLRKLCKIIPKITGLYMDCNERKINLRPLSALTGLSSVSITGYKYDYKVKQQLYADLSYLPSSVTDLGLVCIDIRSSCLRSLKITNLRLLNIKFDPYQAPRICWDLLQRLPNLEVQICRLLLHFLFHCYLPFRLQVSLPWFKV